MIFKRSIAFLAGGAVLLLVGSVLAGCGGGGSSAQAAAPKTASGQAATVGVANTDLGDVLVNSAGMTLYIFSKDTGNQSTCTGACAQNWPPLTATGKPTAGSGASASLLSTSARSDGGQQVTYNGHPVYTFVNDKQPGDTSGQGINAFGGNWTAVSSAGTAVSGSSSSGGGGLGY
jgi:predicted lipoprotein with Yx(FWY)xxD motif